MTIYECVNSRDIREFLQKTGFVPNALESAWLVYQSNNHTIEEKHEAWEWIIKNMPDCEVIRPSQITNFAAWRREERHGAVSLKDLIDVLGTENKNALTLENGGAWSTSDGKLLDSDGDVVADLNDELHLYCFWYHGGMFWNKKSELYPVGHLGALGFRFSEFIKKELGIYTYVSTKKKEATEEELQDIGRLDITASAQLFNFALNYGCFDSECG